MSSTYKIGEEIVLKPATVALGYPSTGWIVDVLENETFQYMVVFKGGAQRKLHDVQIQGRVLYRDDPNISQTWDLDPNSPLVQSIIDNIDQEVLEKLKQATS